MLLQEKRLNPTKFASHWEMDDEDVDEATEEEKQSEWTGVVYLFKDDGSILCKRAWQWLA